MFTLARPQLCLVTDPAKPNLVQQVERALAAGVTMLQLRGHALPYTRLYSLAIVLHELCQKYRAAFIVNDCVDIGLVTGADGFQLGSRSLPLAVVRQLVGRHYLLGASVHSQEEARAAIADGVDFLLAGTIFASSSHPGKPPAGTRLVRSLKRMKPDLPLLAIGGITHANAGLVMEAGADGIAVISAILDAANVEQAVRDLRTSIGF